MSQFPSYNSQEGIPRAPADRLAREARISKSGSHKQLESPNYSYEYTWAFHDGDEIGPKMLAKIAKKTGLKPEDI